MESDLPSDTERPVFTQSAREAFIEKQKAYEAERASMRKALSDFAAKPPAEQFPSASAETLEALVETVLEREYRAAKAAAAALTADVPGGFAENYPEAVQAVRAPARICSVVNAPCACESVCADMGRCFLEQAAESTVPAPRPLHESVKHPDHYNSHPSGVECLTITRHMGFNIGNAIKYLWRADLKGDPIENLRKAAFYIEDEIKRRTGV